MVLLESKLYCGRISRQELEYYIKVPYLDYLCTMQEKYDFFTKVENMTMSEKKALLNEINNFFRNILNRIENTFHKYKKTLDPWDLNQISGVHGGYAHSIFGGTAKSFSGGNIQEKLSRQLDEKECFIEKYNTEYNKILDQYNKLLVLSNNVHESPIQSKVHQDNYINHLRVFKEYILDFILENLPGRTFLNS